MIDEAITMMPLVPPAMNALCQAAEAGQFPREHQGALGQSQAQRRSRPIFPGASLR